MTNVDIMRQFFHDLPERMLEDSGVTEQQINAWDKDTMLQFIEDLSMDYPTAAEQQQFEINKKAWALIYELGMPAVFFVDAER